MLIALEAVVLGDTSRFDELFTDDVVLLAPHVSVTSIGAVRRPSDRRRTHCPRRRSWCSASTPSPTR